jgi:hypothetical protein
MSVQLVAQQIPATQMPLAQLAFVEHVPPFAASGTHAVPLHVKPDAQSALVWQDVLQVAPPHTYAPQLVPMPTGLHVPVPLQVAAGVATPLLQAAGTHTVVDG